VVRRRLRCRGWCRNNLVLAKAVCGFALADSPSDAKFKTFCSRLRSECGGFAKTLFAHDELFVRTHSNLALIVTIIY